MVPLGRLERPTNSLGNCCSVQLSYRGLLFRSIYLTRSTRNSGPETRLLHLSKLKQRDINYLGKNGAGDEIRTRDPLLGKEMLYH